MLVYILKSNLYLFVLLVSYYFLFRRDKWLLFNRFYLLFAVVFSLITPVLNLSIPESMAHPDNSHLNFVNDGIINLKQSNLALAVENVQLNDYQLEYNLAKMMYLMSVLIMAVRYFNNIRLLLTLRAKSEVHSWGTQRLVLISEKTNPFCFGKDIFLNKDDYINQRIDADIVSHEGAHARHLHTLDILFIELVLIFYWFNPLLWCYRYLVKANHEYYADNHVLNHGSSCESYSGKLLKFLNQTKQPLPVSGFNYSLIKNRIIMMTSKKSSKLIFGQKLLVSLSFLAVALIAFSFTDTGLRGNVDADSSKFTVIIDAAHGGEDPGATDLNHQYLEKDIVLSIANAIKEVSKETSIEFIYTRSLDKQVGLADRANLAKVHKADLFVSLHINNHENPLQRGLEVYYFDENTQSQISSGYSSKFAKNLRIGANTETLIKKGNFFVLRDSGCPAVLLNLGFLSNVEDLKFLNKEENQILLAEQIVNTIVDFSKN